MIPEEQRGHYKQWLENFTSFKELKLVMSGVPRPHEKIKRKNHYVDWIVTADVPYLEGRYKRYRQKLAS